MICGPFFVGNEEGSGEGLDHIAVDGKRLRGSRHGAERGPLFCMLLRSVCRWLLVRWWCPPDSAEVIEAIREGSSDYSLFVKGNQPQL